jgi:hypothetical protein
MRARKAWLGGVAGLGACIGWACTSFDVETRYRLGGEVAGLAGELVLADGAASLRLSASGAFTFGHELDDGQAYEVQVLAQPKAQSCTVQNGKGAVRAADVTDVKIVCSDVVVAQGYTLGGTVTGLVGVVALANQGASLVIDTDGPFVFAEPLADGEMYDVTVAIQPAGGSCTVAGGKGSVAGADVDDVAVSCVAQPLYKVGGKVTGLAGKLVITNGGDDLSLDADADFSFKKKHPSGALYAVEVKEQPAGQLCTVESGIGTIMGADVTDVVVRCASDDATLKDLVVSLGALVPAFSPATLAYQTAIGALTSEVTVTPTASDAGATVRVEGTTVGSGTPSPPIALAPGASTPVEIVVRAKSGTEKTYVVSVDRAAKLIGPDYFKASNTEAGDNFGVSVAISGDTMVVGATNEDSSAKGVDGDQNDNSAPDSGAVYVFVRDAMGKWSQQAYLKASNSAGSDFFGRRVALDGDTLVVGAPFEDSSAKGVDGNQADNSSLSSGAAYVFVRDAMGKWSQEAYLKASNTASNDQFGVDVAISGDTIVIGAFGEDSSAPGVNGDELKDDFESAGAAYVFVRSGGDWKQQAYLKASNPGPGDFFGFSVAISGDTAVVGAHNEDSSATGIDGNPSDDGAPDSGAAYVFHRTGGTWAQQAYLKASNTGPADSFGVDVAISGNTVAVGAHLEDSSAKGPYANQADNGANGAGATYVFERSGPTWFQQAYLKASNTGANDQFGLAVALAADVLVAGAYLEDSFAKGVDGNQDDNGAVDAGAAYVFVRKDGLWVQEAYLKASNTGPGDQLGRSGLSVSDGTVVISAALEASSATGVNGNGALDDAPLSGAAYLFR